MDPSPVCSIFPASVKGELKVNRFIKTFYLWLGVMTVCNLMSLLSDLWWDIVPEGGLTLYPIAWLMQLPGILLLSLLHHGINQLLYLLPDRYAFRSQWLVSVMMLYFFTAIYVASQIMRTEVETFLSWDMLMAGLCDLKQILPDIYRRAGFHMVGIGILSILCGLLYTRRYRNPLIEHSGKIFCILLAVFICSTTSSFAFAFKSLRESAWRVRNDILPTTYLTSSLVEDILLETGISEDAIRTIVLPPKISLNDYLETSAPRTTPNVFFIMLEAVPWDHLPFTGYERTDVTPHLNELARHSTIFPCTYATANHSSYSQPSTHASQYPLRTTALDQYETVDYPKVLLFDILAHAGYQTAFISAQNEDWLGMKRFILAHTDLQYFLHSKDELGSNIGMESKIDDRLVRTRAVEYMEGRNPDEPVFMYINFQRTHFPYDIPEDAPRPYQPCSTDDFKFTYYSYEQGHVQTVINKFDNALHYVDAQVGAFIDYLKANGLYENSLIIVAADHGEAFYEHGYPTHSTSLYDDQIRTFTLIKQPGQTASALRNDPISLIDINPTILEAIGMANHPNFQGQQVLNAPRSSPIYIMSHSVVKAMGIVDFPWKYFWTETRGPRLLNLETDPSESADLSAEHPEKLQELKLQLETYRQQQLYYYQDLEPDERSRYYPPRL